jgi:hypothetical protein
VAHGGRSEQQEPISVRSPPTTAWQVWRTGDGAGDVEVAHWLPWRRGGVLEAGTPHWKPGRAREWGEAMLTMWRKGGVGWGGVGGGMLGATDARRATKAAVALRPGAPGCSHCSHGQWA